MIKEVLELKEEYICNVEITAEDDNTVTETDKSGNIS